MRFTEKWSFAKKLMTVNAGYVLPCAVLVYFLMADKGSLIEFNARERIGLEFLNPLQTIFANACDHKIMILSGQKSETSPSDAIKAVETQILHEFDILENLDPSFYEILRYNTLALTKEKKQKAAVESLKADWLAISDSGSTQEANEEAYDKFLQNLRTAISHVGNASNLILDSDLDSYYLMDTLLIAMVDLNDHLQQALSYVLWLGEAQELSEAQKIKLNVLATTIKADLDHVFSSVQTALSEDKNFMGVSPSTQRDLPIALKEFHPIMGNLISNIFEFAETKNPQEVKADVLQFGKEASNELQKFRSKVASDLDKLLDIRIEHLKKWRLIALFLAVLAWVPIVIISVINIQTLSRRFIKYVAKLENEAALTSRSSIELSQASQTVSSGSTEQAAAIQETGASISEITSMASRSASQTESSQALAQMVREETDKGCQVMERVVLSMEAIQEANAKLQNISTIISSISEKTNLINDIVGKTQLLSFNASIEAARAGQHGRGFAVVAEEVGNLAKTSGNAAKEIKSLIEDSKGQVEQILKSTVDRVLEGRSITAQAQEIFLKIAKDISSISTQIASISEASKEQQFGIEQIAKAMMQMDHSTQENNNAAYSAARLSEQLLGQSRDLMGVAKTISAFVAGSNSGKTDVQINRLEFTEGSKTFVADLKGTEDELHSTSTQGERLAQTLSKRVHELGDSDYNNGIKLNADDDSFRKNG